MRRQKATKKVVLKKPPKKVALMQTFCTACEEKKEITSFKILNSGAKTGKCIRCCNRLELAKRKNAKDAVRLNKALDRAHNMLGDTLAQMQRAFRLADLPYENQVFINITKGTLNIIEELTTRMRQDKHQRGEEIGVKSFWDFQNAVTYPIIMYTLKKSNGSQSVTAQVLGISRNKLRSMLFEIAATVPVLVDNFGCWDYMPKTVQNMKEEEKRTYLLVNEMYK